MHAEGVTITTTWSEDAEGETRTCMVDDAGTCTLTVASPTVGGDCTVTATSPLPRQVELPVHTVIVLAVDAPVLLNAGLPGPAGTIDAPLDHVGETAFVLAEEHQDSAAKTWVRIDASVTPPGATNPVAESHVIEVEATVEDGGAGVALDRMQLCFVWTGDGTPRTRTASDWVSTCAWVTRSH